MYLQDSGKQADLVFLLIAIGIKGKCPQDDGSDTTNRASDCLAKALMGELFPESVS